MRLHAARGLRRDLPRATLRRAPELALLALLDHAIDVAVVALRAEHPMLAELGTPTEPTPLRRARAVLRATLSLRGALDRYRAAVADVIDTPHPDDSLF